ncbi:hypothetical protein [Virgibacillus sp. YIM 98842]|uniref:hypothetical protein n=1 Tax=Virgibacillus sp. YIM 98842 TaxID=2663533 RepID=UPI0013DBF117|nr:hypothetical protein [Virgibacillus sp. YIM 98842]
MLPEERNTLNYLAKKVKQQENTITQLIEIIAATNRRITDVGYRLQDKEDRSTVQKDVRM